MKHLFRFNESDLSDWLDKHYGKKDRLEDQFLDVVSAGINAEVEEVSKMWIFIVMFKSALIDKLGMSRRDNIIKELQYRIVDGENPKKVCGDILKKLPKVTKEIEDLYKKI